MLLLTEVGCLWYHWIENEEIADLKDHKETDEKGTVSFDLAAGGKHAITLSGTPKGYAVEKFTLENVDNAWLKLCYYYDKIG